MAPKSSLSECSLWLEGDVHCTLYECLLFLVTGRSVMLEPEALKRQFQ